MPVVTRIWPRQIAVELLVISGIGLVLGLLGPFGTYAVPTAQRLFYWISFILIGYAIYRPATRSAFWLSDHSKIPVGLALGLAAAVAALPLSLLIGFAIGGFRWDSIILGENFGLLYLQCAGIGVGIFLLMRLVFPDEHWESKPQGEGGGDSPPFATETNPATVKSQNKPKIFDRLPVGFPDRILALSVEDHYVRVHAPDRGEMLLMRLGDAIDEMDGLEGTQVHRSWWVARDAIIASKRQDRNLRLALTNGLEVPVSRNHVAKLKQLGWID